MDAPSELWLTAAEQDLLDKFDRQACFQPRHTAAVCCRLPLAVIGTVHGASSSPCSYDDYLYSFVKPNDLKYLQSEEAARCIVELGCGTSQQASRRSREFGAVA